MKPNNFLAIRILLQLLNRQGEDVGVTKLARMLGEEKYTISRVLAAMEEEGLISRKTSKYPQLTNIGRRQAEQYAERMEVIENHLTYEGLDAETAENDAFYWAVYSSEETIKAIKNLEERYRIRYEFRDRKSFSGAELCAKLRDGNYQFPFLIYREQAKDGSNLSMANEGFEHPCTLQVRDGIGKIVLHSIEMAAQSGKTKHLMKGRVSSLKYYDQGEYFSAEKRGSTLTFPASELQFQSLGSGAGQILHGSISMKMECSVGVLHMPESVAIFTMII